MTTLPNIDSQMIANNITPFSPTHPGELVADELEYRQLDAEVLAERIGVNVAVINDLLKGKTAVDTQLALLLEAALGIDADIFLRLQADFNMQTTKADRGFMARLAQIRRIAAVL